MEMFGQHFVIYVARRMEDHQALLSVLGRHLRDFLNGLDNLHDSPFPLVLVLLRVLPLVTLSFICFSFILPQNGRRPYVAESMISSSWFSCPYSSTILSFG